MRPAALATAIGLLLAGSILWHPTVWAVGELQGQTLQPARDLETALESILGGLLGGGQQPPGRIERATVTEDEGDRLAVRVAGSAGLEGRRLRGELLGRDRRVQRQYPSEPSRFDEPSREADLVFRAPAGAGADELPESAYLRLSIDGMGGPGARRVYRLDKRWGDGSGRGRALGGARLLRIRPRPEALAAALPPQEPPTGVVVAPPVRPRPGVVRDHRTRRALQPMAMARVASPAAVTPPPGPRQRQALLATTAAVARSLPKQGQFAGLDATRFTLTVADQNLGARGPGSEDFDLLDDVVADDVDLDAAGLTTLDPRVQIDQNPASGFFYFRPKSYHLQWLKDEARYNMATLYLAAAGGAAAGEVSMAAGLTAGVDRAEVELAEALLRAQCARSGRPFKALRPLPVDPTRVGVSLAGTLRLFNVPQDKVAPVGLSDVLGELQVAWVTDAITKENVELVMEQGGINGSVSFPAAGGSAQSFLVDLQIKLADPGSFGRARWRRGERWRNQSPYPLRLRHLHALLVGTDNRPVLYSWGLGDAVVGPGGEVEWDAAAVPSWLDARAKRMWLSYGVQAGCEDCDRSVLRAITGGVTAVDASQITFHTINPIAETGAYELALRVRSRYFDPEGREVQEKSLILKADNQDFTLGPLYTGASRSAGTDGGALFEYLLTLGMPDGSEHQARRWLPSQELRVLIGRKQIENALGFVPGAARHEEPPPSPEPAPGPGL